MKEFWDHRYSKASFTCGKEPNVFFKQELDRLNHGKILLPADGDGRNSVYAAIKGWNVYASDLSQEGKEKATKLARENGVNINYQVADFRSVEEIKSYFSNYEIALLEKVEVNLNEGQFHVSRGSVIRFVGKKD